MFFRGGLIAFFAGVGEVWVSLVLGGGVLFGCFCLFCLGIFKKYVLNFFL